MGLHKDLCISCRLSLADRNPAAFHSCVLSVFLSQLLCYRLGTPARGLAHISQGNPPATEISLWHFSCCLWEPSQPSHDSSTLPTSHVVLRLFLLSVWCYKVSLPQLFSCLFQMISPQFCCNSSEVLGGG